MKNLMRMAVVALVVMAGRVVRAEEGNHWGEVAKYVDDQTLLVAHLDVGKVDLGQLEAFANRAMDAAKIPAEDVERKGAGTMSMMAKGYQSRFTKLGGRHVYFLMSHVDAWPAMQPVAFLMPLEKGGDTTGMVDFLKAALGKEATVGTIDEGMVYVGEAAGWKRFTAIKAAGGAGTAREDVQAGMGLTEGAALGVVFAPTKDERRALAELMPRLPAEVTWDATDGSTDFITRGMTAGFLRVDVQPQLTVKWGALLASEKDGKRMTMLISHCLELVRTNKEFLREAPRELQDFVGKLAPVLETMGSGVGAKYVTALTLDEKQIMDGVATMAPAIEKAREMREKK